MHNRLKLYGFYLFMNKINTIFSDNAYKNTLIMLYLMYDKIKLEIQCD